jgi:hypothetical protein
VLAALRDQRAQLAGHLQAIAALPSAGVTGPWSTTSPGGPAP